MHIAGLVKIPCYLLKLSSGNENMGVSRADNSVKNWRNLAISNPKPDLHNINAHTKFGEIHWCLLKLSSGNENMGVSRADNSVKNWRNFAISNPKPDLKKNQCTYQVWWKSIDVYSSYHPETKNGRTDGRMTDGQTNGLTDDQRETIVPRHYCVAGYKKDWKGYWTTRPLTNSAPDQLGPYKLGPLPTRPLIFINDHYRYFNMNLLWVCMF